MAMEAPTTATKDTMASQPHRPGVRSGQCLRAKEGRRDGRGRQRRADTRAEALDTCLLLSQRAESLVIDEAHRSSASSGPCTRTASAADVPWSSWWWS